MHLSRMFLTPFHGQDDQSFNSFSDEDDSGLFPMGYGLPNFHRAVVVIPHTHTEEHSPWKLAGMAMLLISAVLASLVIIYYCVMRCCCYKKPTETDVEENAETANDVNAESQPPEVPSIDSEDKQTGIPASFLESPTLNVSQPFQPEPEDLARMQEVMLAKLESTNDDWDIGHGDNDKKRFF